MEAILASKVLAWLRRDFFSFLHVRVWEVDGSCNIQHFMNIYVFVSLGNQELVLSHFLPGRLGIIYKVDIWC